MDKLESQTSKEATWRNHLARHAASGKSIAAFCRDEAISEGNFHAWRTKLRDGAVDLPAPPPRATFINLGAVNSAVASRAAEHSPAPAPLAIAQPRHPHRSRRRRADDREALMFFPEGQVRVFLYRQPVSMRRSFDGLYALARHVMHQDPLSGNLFAFINRRATQIRVLYFDRTGLCVWAKADLSATGPMWPAAKWTGRA